MKTFKEVLAESSVDGDVGKIVSEIKQFFKRTSGVDVRDEDPKQWHNPRIVAAIGARYWGKWHVPDDVEDDGDYDWEVLDSSSASLLRSSMKQIEAKHSKYKLNFGAEEKNWIMVTVEKK